MTTAKHHQHGDPTPPEQPVDAVWQSDPAAGPGSERSSIGSQIAAGLGIAIGALLLLAVFAYLVLGLGVGAFLAAGIAALLPLGIVLLAIAWIDRWEPEPRPALWFGFLWGAGAAVAIALLVDLSIQVATYASGGQAEPQFVSAVIQAPLVEESAKGLGVLLIFWAGRRYFDGPVDGLVYAGITAAGFAFTENILYFGQAFLSGNAGEGFATFITRGIFSPFAHVMFTSCTGLAIGLASRRTGSFGVLPYFVLGLIPAMALHALWNGAFFVVTDIIVYYFLVQVPLFLLALGIVIGLRRYERSMTRARLEEYAAAGWFNATEVNLVSSWGGRNQALRWASSQPPSRTGESRVNVMKHFLRDATRLAHARQRLIGGRAAIGSSRDEQTLLAAIARDRQALSS